MVQKIATSITSHATCSLAIAGVLHLRRKKKLSTPDDVHVAKKSRVQLQIGHLRAASVSRY